VYIEIRMKCKGMGKGTLQKGHSKWEDVKGGYIEQGKTRRRKIYQG
jgi:hypothetical protein